MVTGELKNRIDSLWDIFAAGGLLMLDPSTVTDLAGIVVFAVALTWQILSAKRHPAAEA